MTNLGAKACLDQTWGNVTELQCPPVWDGFICWGPTEAGKVAYSSCPQFRGSDISKFATRICSLYGEWLSKTGKATSFGWTNYTLCLTPEIRDIISKLGSNDDSQSKFRIAENTRILELIGLSFSLVALLFSLVIFYYFRTLRNNRTRLHRHLFIAMMIQVGIRLIVYTDQAVTRSMHDVSINMSSHGLETADVGETSSNPTRRGIENTPILCEASYICLEYARTAMFLWMFGEGLFLHNKIAVNVFQENLPPSLYSFIGWVLPIPLTVTWALVTHMYYGTATCWWGYNFTVYFWILEGPRLAVLLINLAFLLNILRVVIHKLRQTKSSELQQSMKAVKAALVLLPLFGLTNLLNMLDAPLEKSPFYFAVWSYASHLLTSLQGLVLAILYCFRNREVQLAIQNFIRTRIRNNTNQIIFYRAAIPLPSVDPSCSYKNSNNQLDSTLQNAFCTRHNSNTSIFSMDLSYQKAIWRNYGSFGDTNSFSPKNAKSPYTVASQVSTRLFRSFSTNTLQHQAVAKAKPGSAQYQPTAISQSCKDKEIFHRRTLSLNYNSSGFHPVSPKPGTSTICQSFCPEVQMPSPNSSFATSSIKSFSTCS